MTDQTNDSSLDEARVLFEEGAGTVAWEDLPVDLWRYIVYESTANIPDFTAKDLLSLILTGPLIRDALLRPEDDVDRAKARSLLRMTKNIKDYEFRALLMGVQSGRYDAQAVYDGLMHMYLPKMESGSTRYRFWKLLILDILKKGVAPQPKGFSQAVWKRDEDLVDVHESAVTSDVFVFELSLREVIREDYVYGMEAIFDDALVNKEVLNKMDYDGERPIDYAIHNRAWGVLVFLLGDVRVSLDVNPFLGESPWERVLACFPPKCVLEAFARRPDFDTQAVLPSFGKLPFQVAVVKGIRYCGWGVDSGHLSKKLLLSIRKHPLPDKIVYMFDTVGARMIRDFLLNDWNDILRGTFDISFRKGQAGGTACEEVFGAFYTGILDEAERRIAAEEAGPSSQ